MWTCELVEAVEDSFRIFIPDEDARGIVTAGELHLADSKACLTGAAFYRVRRGISSALGIDRCQIGPSTPLESILPGRIAGSDGSPFRAPPE